MNNIRNYPAAPHLAAIGPAHVDWLRIAGPLTAICGAAEQLRFRVKRHFPAVSWIVTNILAFTLFIFHSARSIPHLRTRRRSSASTGKQLTAFMVLLSAVITTLVFVSVSTAATFTVSKTADTFDGGCDADCSLREAISAANINPDHDTILIPAGTYAITRGGSDDNNVAGDFDIVYPVAIAGAGSGLTIIDGVLADRIFHKVTNTDSFSLEGVTLYRGQISGAGGCISTGGNVSIKESTLDSCTANANHGGAIYAGGVVSLDNTTLSSNSSGNNGGAIYSQGLAIVNGATFINNYSVNMGGAVYNSGAASTITGSGAIFFTNNDTQKSTNDRGGAIFSEGSITLTGSCSFTGNDAEYGGAIYLGSSAATVSLGTAIFDSNTAPGHGGALYTYGLTIVGNATFINNYTSGAGAGIYSLGSRPVSITGDATFTNNDTQKSTSDRGGAIWSEGAVTITGNSIFTGNDSEYGGAIYLSSSSATVSLGGNATFDSNTAPGNGGAIYTYGLTIGGNATFINNYTNSAGAGIYSLGTNSVTISGTSTFTNNDTAKSTADRGGAIYSAGGNLILGGASVFVNNDAEYGGAIYLQTGSLTMAAATFTTNTAPGHGGAIYTNGLTMTGNAAFSGNSAGSGEGGAMYSAGTNEVRIDGIIDFNGNIGGAIRSGGDVVLNPSNGTSTFHQNTNADNGGAIYAVGTVSVTSPIFTENTTTGNGGAIAAGGTVSISGNASFADSSANANGGAVYAKGLTIDGDASFVDNYAVGAGGGIYSSGANPVIITGAASFTNNDTQASTSDRGGAIWSEGSVIIGGDSLFENSYAEYGGAIYINSATATVLLGGNAIFTNNSAPGNGGAIHTYGLTIEGNATFSNNFTSSAGGAIYSIGTTPVNISGTSSFTNNDTAKSTNDRGGAIYSEASVTLGNASTFTDCDAEHGGAIFVNTGSLTLVNPTFENNTVPGNGGAIYTHGLTITGGASFIGNSSNDKGGAVCSVGAREVSITGGTNTFTNNHAGSSTGDYGGAIYSEGNLTLDNAAFIGDNNATADAEFGGAIFMESAASLTIANTSFTNLYSTIGAGAIYARGGTLSDVSFTGNHAGVDDGGAIINVSSPLTITGTANTFVGNYGGFSTGDYGGTIYSTASMTVNNAEFTGNNDATPDAEFGGAIFMDAGTTLNLAHVGFHNFYANIGAGAVYSRGGTFTDVSFVGNHVNLDDGGAIINVTSPLTINGSTNTFTDNYAATGDGDYGGTIFSIANLTISNSVFTGNNDGTDDARYGGAIFMETGTTLQVSDSSFENFSATASGGAVYTRAGSFQRTLFVNNSASADGGAVRAAGGGIKYINSTFSGNHAGTTGGAIESPAACTIINSTFTNNSAQTSADAIKGATCTMENSIVTQATPSTSLCSGVTSNGYNIQYHGSCFTAQGSDQVADPLLLALADNGGPTRTHALGTAPILSPAVDRGLNSTCISVDVGGTDQRGQTRPSFGRFGVTCDIGALEYHPLPSTAVGMATGAVSSDTTIDITMPYSEDANTNSTYSVEYKLSSSGTWLTWQANPKAHVLTPFTDTITGLLPGRIYDLRLTYHDDDGVTGTNPQIITDKTLLIHSVDLTTPAQTLIEDMGKVIVTATLSHVSGAIVTVPFTVSGTATGGGIDHDLSDGAITISAGELSATTTFTLINDTIDEPAETVVITMGEPVNAVAGAITVQTVTVKDNDNEPHMPVNLSPVDNASEVITTPTLVASAYADTENDPHKASQWQIAPDPEFTSIVYDSGPMSEMSKTRHSIAATLAANTHYYWRVRYQDGNNGWSDYSQQTSFTTANAGATWAGFSPDANGYIKDWLLLGPHASSGCGDVTTSYDNEANTIPTSGAGPYNGKFWTDHHDPDTLIDFASIYGGANTLAYAAVHVYSPSTRAAQLRLGSDDSIVAWINGEKVHQNPACRPASADNDIVAVTLQQGWNLLVVKVINGSGGWGLYCRFTHPNGSPMTDLELSLVYEIGSAPQRPTNTSPLGSATGVALLPTLTASSYNDADGHIHAASRWQIRRSNNSYGDMLTSYDSGISSPDLESHTLPLDWPLLLNTEYFWRVQYRDDTGMWSSWSAETSFTTTASNSAPAKPSALSPIGVVAEANPRPQLQASAFSDPNLGDVHYASEWRVAQASGNYAGSNLVYTSGISTVGLTSIVVPSYLAKGKTYYWQVRYQDDSRAWSPWSTEASFTTVSNFSPDKPWSVSPVDNPATTMVDESIGVSQTPTLTASVFIDADSDGHQSSHWQLSTGSGAAFEANIVYDSGPCVHLTAFTVGTTLNAGTIYYWRVRYQDSNAFWSAWSDDTSFTTVAQPSAMAASWKFDEGTGSTTADATGNGFNGTINNAEWTQESKFGKALNFRHNDSVSTAFNIDQGGSKSYTIEAWVYPFTNDASLRAVWDTDNGGYDWRLYKSGPRWYVFHGSNTWDTGLSVDVKQWQHLVVVYDVGKSQTILYKNGVAATYNGIGFDLSDSNFVIGSNSLSNNNYFDGIIDEVVVYEKALTAEEVIARYARKSTPPVRPSNQSPVTSATGIAITPQLAGSAFSDADSAEYHAASRFQIRKVDGVYGSADSWDSGETVPVTAIGGWQASGWQYRRTITLAAAPKVAGYQVKIELNAGNFDYTKVAGEHGDDIRFLDALGNNLPYWIETWNPAGTSTLWVKVTPAQLAAITMYYGNPGAIAASDWAEVFAKIVSDDDRLQALWHLDEGSGDGSDSSGNGYVGTVTNAVRAGSDGGYWGARTDLTFATGNSLIFNGSSSWMSTTLNIDQGGTKSYSFETWVYPIGTDATNRVVWDTDNGGYDWRLYKNGGSWYIFNGITVWNTGVSVDVNQWQHLVVVFIPDQGIIFYKNGTPTVSGSVGFDLSDRNLVIGSNSLGNNNFFDGRIDEVAVYARELTADEVMAHYQRRRYVSPGVVASVGSSEQDSPVFALDYLTPYAWRVQHQDNTGVWSLFSSETVFTTVADVAPTTPADLAAVVTDSCQIRLSWVDTSNGSQGNETGFILYRKTGVEGAWETIATVGANVTTYVDTSGLSANTVHFYKVAATNTGGDSATTGEVSATPAAITYYQDSDGDTYGNNAVTQDACDVPEGYVIDNSDCNDGDAMFNPATLWYLDADGDRYSDGTTLTQCAAPGATYHLASTLLATSGDCDDADPAVTPTRIWYRDGDGDGYSGGTRKTQCLDPGLDYFPASALISLTKDCDDANSSIKPGTGELCDGVDNNCDGQIDEGLAAEYIYYRDADNDSYGDAATQITSCQASAPAGYVGTIGDCNDASSSIRPGAVEYCDQVDDDCNGVIDDSCLACEGTPSAPADLTATAINSRIIQLNWTDTSACENGFELEVKDWNGIWHLRQTLVAGTTAFADTIGIMPSTEYVYRITAVAGLERSGVSNEASVTTPAYSAGDNACQ